MVNPILFKPASVARGGELVGVSHEWDRVLADYEIVPTGCGPSQAVTPPLEMSGFWMIWDAAGQLRTVGLGYFLVYGGALK
jgi:hypothetical protein